MTRIEKEFRTQCFGVLAPFFGSVRFDPKRHEDVSHSKSFAKSCKTSFLLAFIRVFRGLNFGCGKAALGGGRLSAPPLSSSIPSFVRVWETK
jgi:hypothetical protein